MNINNFNNSSTGVNLELSVFRDEDRSRFEFEESFHVLQYRCYRQNSIVVFNGFGDQDVSDFEFTDLDNYDVTKVSVKELFKAYLRYQFNKHDSLCFYSDIKSIYENLGINNISLNDLDQFELLEHIETALYCTDNYREFLDTNFDSKYLTFESRGYCQGDYSEIIVPKKVIDSYINDKNSAINSNEDFEKVFSDNTFDRLLWDQPIYARLEIDDQEFYFDEYMPDQYDYDKDNMIKLFDDNYKGDKKALIIEFLENELPGNL